MMMDQKKSHRIAKLDGLRGLLSLIVALNHSYLVLAIPLFANVWGQNYLDLHDLQSKIQQLLMVLGNGGVAVTLFFVLSGLVLGQSLSRISLTSKGVISFIFKRLIRLYPVYLLIVILTALYMRLGFSYTVFPAASTWFTWWMNFQMTFKEFLYNLFFLHTYLGGVTWTLRVILIASFLIPPFYYTFKKSHWLLDLLVIFFLITLNFSFLIIPDFRDLRYLYMFYLGLILPKYQLFFENVSKRTLMIALPVMLILLFIIRFMTNEYTGGVVEAFIAWWLIGLLAYHTSHDIFGVLNSRTFLFLGKISYSLYLIHFSVLYLLARFMFIHFSYLPFSDHYLLIHTLLFFISTPLAIGVSILIYYLVEEPSLKLANFVSQKILNS